METVGEIRISLDKDVAEKVITVLKSEGLEIGEPAEKKDTTYDVIAVIISDILSDEIGEIVDEVLISQWIEDGYADPFIDSGELVADAGYLEDIS